MLIPILLFLLLSLDQGFKYLARKQNRHMVDFSRGLPGCGFMLKENKGFLLQFFLHLPPKRIAWIHGAIITVFSCLLVYVFPFGFDTMEKAGILFLYAGGIGNGLDRWFRRSVTDFLWIKPLRIVVNLADLYLLVGTIFIILGGLA